MTPLPVWFHELVVAPAALALAFLHARRALGAARAAIELAALVLYGYALERAAIAVFASHVYGDGWRTAPGGVPLAVAAVWAATICSAMALAARLGPATALSRAAAAALVGIALDLLIEPVAVRAGLWRWTPAGPWLHVPMGNFVGWAVIVGSYVLGVERGDGGGRLWVLGALRAALVAASVLALLLVGALWTLAGAERVCRSWTAWSAWAALLAATASLPIRGGAPVEARALPGRLGATSGPLPAAVFVLLAATFALDAVALGGPTLPLVALGTTVALAPVLWRGARTLTPSATPSRAACAPPSAGPSIAAPS